MEITKDMIKQEEKVLEDIEKSINGNEECEHKWEAVSVKTNNDYKVYGEFICQKCMSFKEEELKFASSEDSD